MATWTTRGLAAAGPTLIAIATVTGCADGPAKPAADDGRRPTAVGADVGTLDGVAFDVRRDPGCGCCTSWTEYLTKHGAAVELSEDPERQAFRTQQGVPEGASSCHTAVVDGYTIEGHVPIPAIQRLLDERPDAIGLALPGMPADSPGMGGDSTSWANQPVMLIDAQGALVPFDY